MDLVAGVVFVCGLVVLIGIFVWQSRGGPNEMTTLTIRLPKGELRVHIHEDGRAFFDQASDEKLVRMWKGYVWDDDLVEVLEAAGLPPADAYRQAALIADPPAPPPRRSSPRARS